MRRPAARKSIALLLVLFSLLTSVPVSAQQSEADVFVAQAILAYEDKHYDEALAHLREALAQDPKNVEALYYTGLVYIAQQRLDLAIPVLEQARQLAPEDFSVRYLLGVSYFAQERYDLAEPLLTQCFKERPQTEGLGYYVGFMRYRNKNYAGALDAFKAETSPDPAIKQLTHFYSGLALGVMGLPERAASELDAATRGDTPTALTGAAERLRDSFSAGGGAGNRFHAEVRLGFTYDNNVKVLPQPSNDPLANAIRFVDTTSPGEFASVTLSYDWLRYGNWESTIGYQFFQTYVNNFHDFNVQDQVGTLGATYRGSFESGRLAGARFLVGGQYVFDNQTLGGEQFLQRNTGTLFGTLQWNSAGDSWSRPTHVTSPILRFQGKNFTNFTGIPLPPSDNRDANNFMVGLSHTLYWSGRSALVPRRLPVGHRRGAGAELGLSRRPGARGIAVHAAVVVDPHELQHGRALRQLSPRQHALPRDQSRHGQARGHRAGPHLRGGAAAALSAPAGGRGHARAFDAAHGVSGGRDELRHRDLQVQPQRRLDLHQLPVLGAGRSRYSMQGGSATWGRS